MYCTPYTHPAKRRLILTAAPKAIKKRATYVLTPPSAAKVQLIIDVVCNELVVNFSALNGPCRAVPLRDYRKIMYHFLKRYEKRCTTVYLGKKFNRDHSSIINALNSFDDLYQTDRDFKNKADLINQRLKYSKEPPEISTDIVLNITQ